MEQISLKDEKTLVYNRLGWFEVQLGCHTRTSSIKVRDVSITL